MLKRKMRTAILAAGSFVWTVVLVVAYLVWQDPGHSFQVAWTTVQKGIRLYAPPPTLPGPIKVRQGSDPITTVVITGDDGQLSWHNVLFPIIQKHRLACTHFVITKRVGDYGFMTWDQIEEEKAWGCEIGSHTRTHQDLDKLDLPKAIDEIVGSGMDLKERFGEFPKVIASPEGIYDKQALKIMRKAGSGESGYVANMRGWGGENGEVNNMANGTQNAFELVRYNVGNYHTSDDICNAVKKAAGKPQLLIFMYHFGTVRGGPAPKTAFKTFKEINGKVPPPLYVFQDVFEKSMACIAQERDEGRIRVTDIPEALTFYEKNAARMLLAQAQEEPEPELLPEKPSLIATRSPPAIVPRIVLSQQTRNALAEVREAKKQEEKLKPMVDTASQKKVSVAKATVKPPVRRSPAPAPTTAEVQTPSRTLFGWPYGQTSLLSPREAP